MNLNTPILKQFDLNVARSPVKGIDIYFGPLSTMAHDDQGIIFLQRLLSTAERTQCHRYSTPLLKTNAILSRGLLRLILAQYLAQPHPNDLIINRHPFGKPYLLNEPIHFSVSHCDSMLIIAVSRTHQLGIDIENVTKLVHDDLSNLVLSIEESSLYWQQHEQDRLRFFLHCWTRKEAYLKAVGTGLVNHLNQINTVKKRVIDSGNTTLYQCCTIDTDQHHITSLAYGPRISGLA